MSKRMQANPNMPSVLFHGVDHSKEHEAVERCWNHSCQPVHEAAPEQRNYYETADGRRQCLIAKHPTGCKCFESISVSAPADTPEDELKFAVESVRVPAAPDAPIGFWEYLEANKVEVAKWPGWMTGGIAIAAQPARAGLRRVDAIRAELANRACTNDEAAEKLNAILTEAQVREHKPDEVPKIISKLCLWCAEFLINEGSPGFSEYTPGESFEMLCKKKRWEFDTWKDTSDHYRACIVSATVCPDYQFNNKLIQIKPVYNP